MEAGQRSAFPYNSSARLCLSSSWNHNVKAFCCCSCWLFQKVQWELIIIDIYVLFPADIVTFLVFFLLLSSWKWSYFPDHVLYWIFTEVISTERHTWLNVMRFIYFVWVVGKNTAIVILNYQFWHERRTSGYYFPIALFRPARWLRKVLILVRENQDFKSDLDVYLKDILSLKQKIWTWCVKYWFRFYGLLHSWLE